MKKRLNGDDILTALLTCLPSGARASVATRALDAHTTSVVLDWPGGGVSLFLPPAELDVPIETFRERWILPALDGSAPANEPLLCLSCDAPKRPGIDPPCGH